MAIARQQRDKEIKVSNCWTQKMKSKTHLAIVKPSGLRPAFQLFHTCTSISVSLFLSLYHLIRSINKIVITPRPKEAVDANVMWRKFRHSMKERSKRDKPGCLMLKCPYRQNFYFLIWFYISPNELLQKKKMIWIKCNLFRSFKNVQICRHFGPPFAPVFPCFWRNCDID